MLVLIYDKNTPVGMDDSVHPPNQDPGKQSRLPLRRNYCLSSRALAKDLCN